MKTVNGDILTPNVTNRGTIVCHQVNCMGVMGAGLAKQIKTKYPRVFKVYYQKCKSSKNSKDNLGKVQFVSCLVDSGYIIANVFGQYGYGKNKCHTDYPALNTAFENIAEAFPNDVIRIPHLMGCGLAGGD